MSKPRIILMGKDKLSVIEAVFHCCTEFDIEAIICPDPKKSRLSRYFPFTPCYRDIDIYEHLDGKRKLDINLESIDLVISFLFPNKIKAPLIKLGKLGCINFHSAPLPKYRGWGVYNAAILNGEKQWGVSAHFVDESFDTGDLIKVNHFNIDPKKETAYSLENKSQEYLLNLFDEVMGMVVSGKELPRIPQKQEDGVNYSKKDTLKYEVINKEDSDEMIDKKARAFWFPPFSAKIEVNGKYYPFVTQEIIDSIAKNR